MDGRFAEIVSLLVNKNLPVILLMLVISIQIEGIVRLRRVQKQKTSTCQRTSMAIHEGGS